MIRVSPRLSLAVAFVMAFVLQPVSSQAQTACPPTGTFSDDVETVVPDYQTQTTRTTGGWRRSSPDLTASSPDTVWLADDDQPGDPILTAIDHRLVLPPLDLSSTSLLTFNHNFDFARFPETSVFAAQFESGAVLEISADGGANWKDLDTYITTGGYNGTVDPAASADQNPIRGQRAWVGTSNPTLPPDPSIGPNGRLEMMTANPVQVNLGQAIQTEFGAMQLLNGLIRFRLGGTFQILIGGIQGTGWGVDDIRVTNLIVNCAPVAVDDTATTVNGFPVTIPVLANDSDPDGDTLTVTSVTDPPNGMAVNNNDGTVTYTPDCPLVTGFDTFSYTISDGNGGTDTGLVTVRNRKTSRRGSIDPCGGGG
jgi:hypothetical protein